MATDEEPQDWKTAIDFNNLQFGIQVLRMCPDLDFPAEWVDNLWPDWLQNLEDVLDGELPFWRFEQYTPDYGTPKNWVDRPRACLLRPGEDDQFTEYSEMVDNILFEYGFIQYAAPDELDDLVDELQDFREAFSDKELKHFQKEVSEMKVVAGLDGNPPSVHDGPQR